jgi:hypothetical protein
MHFFRFSSCLWFLFSVRLLRWFTGFGGFFLKKKTILNNFEIRINSKFEQILNLNRFKIWTNLDANKFEIRTKFGCEQIRNFHIWTIFRFEHILNWTIFEYEQFSYMNKFWIWTNFENYQIPNLNKFPIWTNFEFLTNSKFKHFSGSDLFCKERRKKEQKKGLPVDQGRPNICARVGEAPLALANERSIGAPRDGGPAGAGVASQASSSWAELHFAMGCSHGEICLAHG